ncbi:hypothetical protein NL676_022228 [Syzygium grande]|nr:hypothetical protein NL676_022228 [Syzygium grande]
MIDVLSTFPKPDDKTICKSMKVQGGGDAANTLTCLARLGVRARLMSKIANDVHGKSLLEELTVDGLDTSFLMVTEDGQTPFSYVIVDQSMRTRTCIFTPGSPLMKPADVSPSLNSALEGARFIYFDARYTDTAIVVAEEAARQNITILLDAEKKRPGLDDLLDLSDYVICSAKFPQAWTEAPSMPSALISMLLRLPKLKFAIVTLGEHGCLMLERSSEENPLLGEEDADNLLHSLEQERDDSVAKPIDPVAAAVAKPSPVAAATAAGKEWRPSPRPSRGPARVASPEEPPARACRPQSGARVAPSPRSGVERPRRRLAWGQRGPPAFEKAQARAGEGRRPSRRPRRGPPLLPGSCGGGHRQRLGHRRSYRVSVSLCVNMPPENMLPFAATVVSRLSSFELMK